MYLLSGIYKEGICTECCKQLSSEWLECAHVEPGSEYDDLISF